MRIVERVRVRAVTVESARTREERDTMQRMLRRANDRAHRAFDQGFLAAVRMVEAGADVERLRAASGVVEAEWADTEPHVLLPDES